MSNFSVSFSTQLLMQELKPHLRELIQAELNKNDEADEQYLTAKEVCDFLQISESTLWRRKRDGSIISKPVGRLIRFPKSQFN